VRSDPFDDAEVPELRVRSMAAFAAGLGLVLSAIGAAVVWLVFTFPVGAASDIAGRAATIAVLEKCVEASRTTTTTSPPAGPTTTTLPLPCSVRP
jgi:hypothetical protein